jgi:hypothetical protein
LIPFASHQGAHGAGIGGSNHAGELDPNQAGIAGINLLDRHLDRRDIVVAALLEDVGLAAGIALRRFAHHPVAL